MKMLNQHRPKNVGKVVIKKVCFCLVLYANNKHPKIENVKNYANFILNLEVVLSVFALTESALHPPAWH